MLSGKKNGAKSKEISDLKAMIPWNELSRDNANKIKEIIEKKTVFRRMPMQTNFCDKKLYQFLMQHPDVVVGMWELMDVTDISLHEIAPQKYKMTENTGSVGDVDVLYQDANLLVAYCDGSFIAPMNPKPIQGETVMILYSRYGTDGNGRAAVQSRMDCYVKIHNPGAELLAKILVPVFGKVADANFEQVMGFVSSVSDVAESDYESIQNIAARLKMVRPAVAKEFAFVAEDVYERASERFMIASDESSLIRESVPLRKKERTSEETRTAAPVPREAPVTVAVRAPFPSHTPATTKATREKSSISQEKQENGENAPLPFPMITPKNKIPVQAASPIDVDDSDEEEDLTDSTVIIQSVSMNTSEFVNSVSRTPTALTLGKQKNIRPGSTPAPAPQRQAVAPMPQSPRSQTQALTPSPLPKSQEQRQSLRLPPKPTRIPVPVIP